MFRKTQDVDASIVDTTQYDRIKQILNEFGELLQSMTVISSYSVRGCVVPTMSGGAEYKDENGNKIISVDISLRAPTFQYILINTKRYGELQISSIEQMLADKFKVLYSRKRFRRSKDLYDAWQIIKNCSIDKGSLVRALTDYGVYPLDSVLSPFNEEHAEQMKHAYDKLRIGDAATSEIITKPEFKEVAQVISSFIENL